MVWFNGTTLINYSRSALNTLPRLLFPASCQVSRETREDFWCSYHHSFPDETGLTGYLEVFYF